MKSMRVCVVGAGYVGLVTGTCLAEMGHRVICVENNEQRFKTLSSGQIPIYEPGLDRLVQKNVRAKRLSFSQWLSPEVLRGVSVAFIAVGTPPHPDGSADLSDVESVAKGIAEHMQGYLVIAEKSTVPVQTGEYVERIVQAHNKRAIPFDMVSNPEFLREGTAISDFQKPDRIVLGTKTKRAEKVMRDLYAPLKCKNIIVTDLQSAELIKHASNSFLATKVSFINSVSRICEKVGADATLVARGMGMDPRIGGSFLQPGIGFGGFCLPKDVEAFRYISKEKGYDFELLSVVKAVNESQRAHFVNKIEKALGTVQGKTIGVWGIAFKPGTDDIRFAPSLDIIAQLQARGAQVQVFDPVAMEKAKSVLKSVLFCKDAYAAADKADAIAVVTEWPEFQKLNFARIKKSMAGGLILDGRNCLNSQKLRSIGFTYLGMGRA